ncbi:hypothetical protein V8E54_000234 [Elaphomyces granulatus]
MFALCALRAAPSPAQSPTFARLGASLATIPRVSNEEIRELGMAVAVVAVGAQFILQGMWKLFLPEEFKRIKMDLEDKVENLAREGAVTGESKVPTSK